jgi:hypothetical protein
MKAKARKGSKGSGSASESESENEAGSRARTVKRDVIPPKAPAKPVASTSKAKMEVSDEEPAPKPVVKAKKDLLAGWVDATTIGKYTSLDEVSNPADEDDISEVFILSDKKLGAKRPAYIIRDISGKSMAKQVGLIWMEGENKNEFVEGSFTGFQ